jgi:hypothetical protein
VNTRPEAGSKALQLTVAEGKPPIQVNATAGKASNLNADKLDGDDSTAFLQSNAAAGGDLSGNYSNLQITGEAVGSSEVANGSLDIPDVAELHYSFTKNPVEINGEGCATISEDQAVVDSGDLVLMNAPDLPSGLVAFPLSTSSSLPQLSFRLCNITSNPIDPPEGLWRTAIFDDGNDF